MALVKVENLYMMLAYAWNRLDQARQVKLGVLPRGDLPNLLARVLVVSTEHLLRRGLCRQYVGMEEETFTPRGKINVTDSIKQLHLSRRRAICDIDEYSADVLPNQIVKATIISLLACEEVDHRLRAELFKLSQALASISTIALFGWHFRGAAAVHRSGRYTLLLHVCRMIHDEMLPSDGEGKYRFSEFTQDEKKMRMLFQAFVTNFYKHELPEFEVSANYVNWDAIGEPSDIKLLPRMQTDSTLRSPERHIIVETKFTPKLFQVYKGKKSLQSQHLYQLSSYLSNQAAALESHAPRPEGLLLYPQTDEPLKLRMTLAGHRFTVATVDLNAEWATIHQRLTNLALS
ncbi:5-methylcytosine restriction system specificity protein McrC [Massilia eburnea]|uniref:5-methylcytosine restriction system specificity protein McrC n=1 Tax=Massilia eburnea TaxID=1776165 RepID=UPI003D6BE4A6